MGGINYYFIRSTIDFDIFKNAILEDKISPNSAAVLWEAQWIPFFMKKGIKYILLDNYTKHIDYGHLRKKVTDMIKVFPHKKFFDDKSLVELLEYDGYSLWWFIRQGFFTDCFNTVKEIYAINLLFKNRKIGSATILNPEEKFISMLKEASRNLNIKINHIRPKFLIKTRYFLNNKKELVLNNFPRIIRIIQGFFRCLKARNKPKKWNILLFTRSHVWSTLSGNIKGDANSYTIMNYMLKSSEYNLVQLDAALTREGAWKGIKEKKKLFIPYDYFIFKSFLDCSIRKKLKFLRSRLRILWKKIDKNKTFKEAIICDDINLYSSLRQHIKSYFLKGFNSFISAARNIEAGKKILEDYNINLTICADENGAARFLVFAAKMNSIPSIGLQHGIITTLWNVSYTHSKNDIYKYKENLNCQIPDKTAVFGNYFKKILFKEGNYPAGKVVVTGQPRFDILYENRKDYSKKNIYKKLGIGNGKKLAVYASQPMKSDLNTAFSAVIRTFKKLKDVKLIVKLHPSDDPSPYKTILQELKYEAIISKNIDLHELIICSDLLISVHSTVILEALALEKPVIQLNLMEKYDIFGEKANKLIQFVNRENQLSNAIKVLLYNKSYSKWLREKRKEFISEYFYKIDGKSTERFIKVLEGMLRGK